jgi:hypothetical protein
MIMWLDHLIFGNGHGLKTPYFDDKFYWLKDWLTDRGELYQFSGGFGAQLTSFQWFHPRPGERRRLRGVDFIAFQSTRQLIRVRVSWAMSGMPDHNIDAANRMIRALQSDLNGDMIFDELSEKLREAA